MGHFVLNFGRVLCGTVDQHVTLFARKGKGSLALKVKVFLTAHRDRAGYRAGRGGQSSGRISF